MRLFCAVILAMLVNITGCNGGCDNDNDCKGDRVCEDGECVDPSGDGSYYPGDPSGGGTGGTAGSNLGVYCCALHELCTKYPSTGSGMFYFDVPCDSNERQMASGGNEDLCKTVIEDRYLNIDECQNQMYVPPAGTGGSTISETCREVYSEADALADCS